MKVLETERLKLRAVTLDDAAFILELLNDPGFLRFIGDKGVRTLTDARGYLVAGPLDSYARFGFGMLVVEPLGSGEPLGLCGLVKRPALDDVDIGYAFLARFRSQGYAIESASAVLAHARGALGLGRVVAITDPENAASIRVLEKLGLRFERMIRLPQESAEIRLYASDG